MYAQKLGCDILSGLTIGRSSLLPNYIEPPQLVFGAAQIFCTHTPNAFASLNIQAFMYMYSVAVMS